ncbi:MAG: thioredoxin family protein [Anaerolineaceae bacterium]|nr:thioredoxin family protein [Anaerolineaceae bacterium]
MGKLLDEQTAQRVKKVFEALNHEVALLLFGSESQNCMYCEDVKQLVGEVTSLSDKLHLEYYDLEKHPEEARKYHVENAPSFVVAAYHNGEITDYGIRYLGIPAGHEFTSLIRDILMVSSGDSGLQPETREFLAGVKTPLLLQVFVTPTCPYCPQAVTLAHQIAMGSPWIEAEMVEAMEFPELSAKYGVSGVPHTVINGGDAELVGAAPEQHLVEKIREAINLKGEKN